MEQRFGHDFSRVRVHTDAPAERSARAVNARAYTVGNDVIFDEGRFAPRTQEGRRLIAHELAHVVQQSNVGGIRPGSDEREHGLSSVLPYSGQSTGRKRLQGHEQPHVAHRINSVIQRQRDRPSVKITNVLTSVDERQAEEKAREIAERIRAGKSGSEDDWQLVNRYLEFFEGKALTSFVLTLQDSLGEKLDTERETTYYPEVQEATSEMRTIVPTSSPKIVRGGLEVVFQLSIFKQTSDSISIVSYTEGSGSFKGGIGLSAKKVFNFSVGGEWKAGTRKSKANERKSGSASGVATRRTFTVQKLERDVLLAKYLKRYHGVNPPKPWGLNEGQLATKTEYISKGNQSETQIGYRILPKSGGEPWGPFWNVFRGYQQVEGTALDQVWEIIATEQRKAAEMLAYGFNRGE
ncbi:DUF4157 domain-containing protein [Halogeometricum sp. S1BR25-6]|uniref:DUF4157 domain-containing protein n=2 Tax=Halogeometricum salsisoli TaxID=2950536 RepID=A0ABU2GLC5_9EURY|nr:DUF4157 domain-containing protein [Halogeometricum sp. S1BR25-6]